MNIKICGITNVNDALMCADAGATMIGLNFVPSSPRYLSHNDAQVIIHALRAREKPVTLVGVTVGMMRVEELLQDFKLDLVQLHGDETPEFTHRWMPKVMKAIRVKNAHDVYIADSFKCDLLIDSYVDGQLGGTGVCVDLNGIYELAQRRRIFLAGGLTSENVADAIRKVRPFGVDVASGVETKDEPRRKNEQKVRAFIAAVRRVIEDKFDNCE